MWSRGWVRKGRALIALVYALKLCGIVKSPRGISRSRGRMLTELMSHAASLKTNRKLQSATKVLIRGSKSLGIFFFSYIYLLEFLTSPNIDSHAHVTLTPPTPPPRPPALGLLQTFPTLENLTRGAGPRRWLAARSAQSLSALSSSGRLRWRRRCSCCPSRSSKCSCGPSRRPGPPGSGASQ